MSRRKRSWRTDFVPEDAAPMCVRSDCSALPVIAFGLGGIVCAVLQCFPIEDTSLMEDRLMNYVAGKTLRNANASTQRAQWQ